MSTVTYPTLGGPGHLDEHKMLRAYMEGKPVAVTKLTAEQPASIDALGRMLPVAYDNYIESVLRSSISFPPVRYRRPTTRRQHQLDRCRKRVAKGKPSYRQRQKRGRFAKARKGV